MKPQRLDRGLIISGKTTCALGNAVHLAYKIINSFNQSHTSVFRAVAFILSPQSKMDGLEMQLAVGGWRMANLGIHLV